MTRTNDVAEILSLPRSGWDERTLLVKDIHLEHDAPLGLLSLLNNKRKSHAGRLWFVETLRRADTPKRMEASQSSKYRKNATAGGALILVAVFVLSRIQDTDR
jgi:hypothetical protein